MKKIAPILVCLLLTTSIAIAETGTDTSTRNNGCSATYQIADYHPFIRKAWKQPHGLSKEQIRTSNTMIRCADPSKHGKKMRGLFDKYKEKFKRIRLLKRLDNKCSQYRPVNCIRYASTLYNYSFSTMYAIAHCESTLNPRAYNPSGAGGLFQFLYSTWVSTLRRMGKEGWSRFNARQASLAAAWKMSHDGTGEWSCA